MKNENVSIRYIVHDVGKSISFYIDHLGFKVDMHPAPGFAVLSRGSLKLLLNQPGAGGAGQTMPDGTAPEPGGWNRIQITIENLEPFYKKLKERGLVFRNKVLEGKGGKQVLLEDPSGNPIELFEPNDQNLVKPIPEGYHTITPFLLADDTTALIEFIKNAFNGKITYMMKSDDGIVRHSTILIGNSLVMVSNGTEIYKSMPAMLHLYVEDVDSVYQQAISAGGESLREPINEFYGDRTAAVKDAWGNQWWIATHVEDVEDVEMVKREREFRKQQVKH